jgi:hypothetical protein
MRSYLSGRAGRFYKQAAGSWNVLDTLGDAIICNHLSATRRFRYVPEPSMGFHEVLQSSVRFHEISWDSMRFYDVLWNSMTFHWIPWIFMRFHDVSVNRSKLTEANRGLLSYIYLLEKMCTHSISVTVPTWPFTKFLDSGGCAITTGPCMYKRSSSLRLLL